MTHSMKNGKPIHTDQLSVFMLESDQSMTASFRSDIH